MDYTEELLRAVGHGSERSLSLFVLGLTVEARAAFLEAAVLAEGTTDGRAGITSIYQNDGEVLDAIILTAYLEGHRPGVSYGRPGQAAVSLGRAKVNGRSVSWTPGQPGPAWCVTTELGSWTMRQGQTVSLTGNSWYEQCVEAEFPLVALDVPSYFSPWYQDEFLAFALRSKVKVIAVSYQLFNAAGGGLDPLEVVGARRIHSTLPMDVAIIALGLGTTQGMAQVAQLYPGRKIIFAGKEPYAQAIFFSIMPQGTSAPKGMSKAEVYGRNVAHQAKMTAKILGSAERKHAALLAGGGGAKGRSAGRSTSGSKQRR